MTPDTRARWKESIMRHEGLVLAVYDDATGRTIGKGDTLRGWPTIGYGRNLTGRGITRQEADLLLHNDMTIVTDELTRLVPWWRSLDQVRQMVLAEMAYNMGAANLVRGWPNFLRRVETGQYLEAAQTMRVSRWASQVRGRAHLLADLMQRGTWS
jgi:lysozyme